MHGVADSAISFLLGLTESIEDGIASESRILILPLVFDTSGKGSVHVDDASVAGPLPGAIRSRLPILEPKSVGTKCTAPSPCAAPDIPVSTRLTYAARHDESFFCPPAAYANFERATPYITTSFVIPRLTRNPGFLRGASVWRSSPVGPALWPGGVARK